MVGKTFACKPPPTPRPNKNMTQNQIFDLSRLFKLCFFFPRTSVYFQNLLLIFVQAWHSSKLLSLIIQLCIFRDLCNLSSGIFEIRSNSFVFTKSTVVNSKCSRSSVAFFRFHVFEIFVKFYSRRILKKKTIARKVLSFR